MLFFQRSDQDRAKGGHKTEIGSTAHGFTGYIYLRGLRFTANSGPWPVVHLEPNAN